MPGTLVADHQIMRRTAAVPTNEQRRATAKRKLERRIYTIVGASVAALVVIGAIVATVVVTNRDSGSQTASAATSTPTSATSAASSAPGQLPAFAAPANLGANCQYPASADKASKPINPPRTGKVPTAPAPVSASMSTNQGNIGLQLDNAKAPCTVNSFANLAQPGFFNDTPCHRLTTSEGLAVLQC